MSTILCLDDFTCTLSDRLRTLRKNGHTVLCAPNFRIALELASENQLDAVILNCQEAENLRLVAALRLMQQNIAVVMFSGYCNAPCHKLQFADACIQKGESVAVFLAILRSVICQRRYGL
jgi:response regulator RpfG family c-di-GMP phosphodiesterase